MRLLLPILCLSACAPKPPAPLPPVQVQTITVEKPIPVPCVDRAQIPVMPPKIGALLNGDAAHDLDVVSASALRLRATLGIALAQLGACAR